MDLNDYIKAVDTQNLKVEGIVVLQRGREIGRHRWIPEAKRNVFSVSKSFTAIAVGMAIDEGLLSLEDRIIDAFPDCVPSPSPRLRALTLEHCLTMTRGHGEFSRPMTVAEALGQSLDYEPGARFVYDNGSTFLASALLGKASGMKLRDYLAERLFSPLGIGLPDWDESGDGLTLGATGLRLSTSGMACFGQFLLQRGSWEGKQLVSPLWIDSATRAHVSTRETATADNDLGYGYCFWPSRHGAYRADGKNGQLVIVLPREEAVVAINSDEENQHPILYAVWDHILPLLRY
jgi:CubicO group peptidase (beta-lactamase class C family)